MAATTQSAVRIENTSAHSGLLDIVKRAIFGIRCGLEAERLLKKSDNELAEIGMTRDEIYNRAFPRYLNI